MLTNLTFIHSRGTYQWDQSTARNYAWQATPDNPLSKEAWVDEVPEDKLDFKGEFSQIRRKLDHSYHANYTPERQQLQDQLVRELQRGEGKERPWIIFTAGAMGAGKGFVMKFLTSQDVIDLEQYTLIDPDAIKYTLPEMREYIEVNKSTAGSQTHQESGYIQEIALETGLRASRNLWIDGSLRNTAYFKAKFADIRQRFPQYRIGILHITAPKEAVIKRAQKRGEETGRFIPIETLTQSLEQVPLSVRELSSFADYSATVSNPGDSPPEFIGGNNQFEVLSFSMHLRHDSGQALASGQSKVDELDPRVRATLERLFQLMDCNQDGQISRAEGHIMAYSLGESNERAVQTWNTMLTDMNTGVDGSITLKDWLEYCSERPVFQTCREGKCSHPHGGVSALEAATNLVEAVEESLWKQQFVKKLLLRMEGSPPRISFNTDSGEDRVVFDPKTHQIGLQKIESVFAAKVPDNKVGKPMSP